VAHEYIVGSMPHLAPWQQKETAAAEHRPKQQQQADSTMNQEQRWL